MTLFGIDRLLADHHTRGYFAYQAVRQGMTQNIYWLGRLPRALKG